MMGTNRHRFERKNMNGKRRQPYVAPDGIDWRDPGMPLVVPWEDRWGQRTVREVSPKEEQEFRRANMALFENDKPNWRDDPSYRWGKRKRRRLK